MYFPVFSSSVLNCPLQEHVDKVVPDHCAISWWSAFATPMSRLESHIFETTPEPLPLPPSVKGITKIIQMHLENEEKVENVEVGKKKTKKMEQGKCQSKKKVAEKKVKNVKNVKKAKKVKNEKRVKNEQKVKNEKTVNNEKKEKNEKKVKNEKQKKEKHVQTKASMNSCNRPKHLA